MKRREALKTGGSLAIIAAAISAGVLPQNAFASWNKNAFDAKNLKRCRESDGRRVG